MYMVEFSKYVQTKPYRSLGTFLRDNENRKIENGKWYGELVVSLVDAIFMQISILVVSA